jgi:hypothetical protein
MNDETVGRLMRERDEARDAAKGWEEALEVTLEELRAVLGVAIVAEALVSEWHDGAAVLLRKGKAEEIPQMLRPLFAAVETMRRDRKALDSRATGAATVLEAIEPAPGGDGASS